MSPGREKVTLWGVLGIIFAVGFAPLGFVFGLRSTLDARRCGRPAALGWVAIGLAVLLTAANLIAITAGAYSGITVR
jgi:hypothetical protein